MSEPFTVTVDGHPAVVAQVGGMWAVSCTCGTGSTQATMIGVLRDLRAKHRGWS